MTTLALPSTPTKETRTADDDMNDTCSLCKILLPSRMLLVWSLVLVNAIGLEFSTLERILPVVS